MEITTIPTVQLIPLLLARLKLCPPRITVKLINPINCKQFRKPQINAAQYPRAYRDWTICRIPVRGPLVAQYVGGMHEKKVKKIIQRMEVFRSRAKREGPIIPSENWLQR